MTQGELWFALAVLLPGILVAIDRWTRFRRPRPKPRTRVDPRKTWALEHELDLYADHPPERRLELLNHGPGCYLCSTIKPSLVGPAHLNGPIAEHERFCASRACRNITSNESGLCGVCEVWVLADPR